jgi:DNA-binding IscR family transcriptional regulator
VCGHYAGQRDECVHSPSCSVRPVWAQIALYLQGMLDSMVLADLLEDEREVRAKIAEVHSAAVSTSALAVGGGFDVRSYGE